jgi:hypothetical protein
MDLFAILSTPLLVLFVLLSAEAARTQHKTPAPGVATATKDIKPKKTRYVKTLFTNNLGYDF